MWKSLFWIRLFQNFNVKVRVSISLICQNFDITATALFLYQISPEAYIFIVSLHLFIQKNRDFSGIGGFYIKNQESVLNEKTWKKMYLILGRSR